MSGDRWDVQPIVAQDLQASIHEKIRDAITSGKLAPGERLRELDLARRFGTSQTPVREALTRLEQERLVVSLGRRGTYVVRLSISEVEEVYSIRAELESWAIRRYVAAASADHCDNLRRIVASMRDAAARGDQSRFIQADVRFHRTICEESGSKTVTYLWGVIDGRARGMMSVANLLVDTGLGDIAELHAPIVEAIEKRDVDEAEALIRRHMHVIWDSIGHRILPD